MKDITDLMNGYRECSRNIWNVYFAKRAQESPGCFIDHFDEIRRLLFESLVLDELRYEDEAAGSDLPPPALRVVPENRVRLFIKAQSDPGRGSYWGDGGEIFVGPEDISLAYVDYFDFSNISLRDFRFYLCKILRFPGYPEYEGREALIEALEGRVFHDEEAEAHL
jgi:hypothetical protein